jgi:hypothetical protein
VADERAASLREQLACRDQALAEATRLRDELAAALAGAETFRAEEKRAAEALHAAGHRADFKVRAVASG